MKKKEGLQGGGAAEVMNEVKHKKIKRKGQVIKKNRVAKKKIENLLTSQATGRLEGQGKKKKTLC